MEVSTLPSVVLACFSFHLNFLAASGGFGWNQEQQDLQLGGLLRLGLSLLGSQQQEDLGFKAGMKGGFSWGAQQDQDFGLFGNLLKGGLSLAGKAARSPAGKYAM